VDTRLGLLSAAAFAGVVIGGLLIADPGVAGAVNPAGLFGGEDDEHEYEDDAYDEDEHEGDDEYEHEREHGDDDHEDDDHDHEDDDDEHEADDDESTRSGDVRFALDRHGDHEDDD